VTRSELATIRAANVRRLREALGWSPYRAYRTAQVRPDTWAHLESPNGNPTEETLCKAAEALGVSVQALYTA
jgi:transcriptional regulator with XRE-family HTH domain